nr:uncharacterized protein LOC106731592 [Pelodiscus sinensis]|eukprot:XP_014426272.1 uncharacterized protein LOC106731592 [Pelodiscus sinensis]
MGCLHRHGNSSGLLVRIGTDVAYQPSLVASGVPCLQTIQDAYKRHDNQNSHRHHHDVLCEQTKRLLVPVPLRRGSLLMEVVHSKRHHYSRIILTQCEQHHHGCIEQILSSRSRVGDQYRRPPASLLSLGPSYDRSLRHSGQQEMRRILFQSRSRHPFSGRCLSPALGNITVICILPCCAHSQGAREGPHGQGESLAHSSGLAQTAMVLNSLAAVHVTTILLPTSTGLPDAAEWGPSSPEVGYSTSSGMDDRWFSMSESLCLDQVKRVLLHSKKDSTRKTCPNGLGSPVRVPQRALNPLLSPLHVLLDYILQLQVAGLSISSLRVHVAAIAAFHGPVEGRLVFSYPMVTRFLKGLTNLNPPRRPPPPAWNLDHILDALTYPPFEPLATVPWPMLPLCYNIST